MAPSRVGRRWRSTAWSLLTLGLLAGLIIAGPPRSVDDRVVAAGSTCVGSVGPAGLTALFDLEPDGLVGVDYQRSLPLPDGRILWTFQDAFIRGPQGGTTLIHNAGMIQNGACFDVLYGGSAANPTSWLSPGTTVHLEHWYWPLDSTIGANGQIWVFMAEMDERGGSYLSNSVPEATHVVALDPTTLQPVGIGRPHNGSASLYGFSITEDDTWTYLYAQCHRQFGFDPTIFGTRGHDFSCSADVTVGRVPRGRILNPPEYWDGASWQSDPALALPVMPKGRRKINPTQVIWTGEEFLAVTKEGDWLGNTIYLDRAPSAQGPWSTYARVPADPKCAPNVCNTYFASWISPPERGGNAIIGLSNNRWDGQLSSVYRPTFLSVPPPGDYAFATRCSLFGC